MVAFVKKIGRKKSPDVIVEGKGYFSIKARAEATSARMP